MILVLSLMLTSNANSANETGGGGRGGKKDRQDNNGTDTGKPDRVKPKDRNNTDDEDSKDKVKPDGCRKGFNGTKGNCTGQFFHQSFSGFH